MPFGNTVGTLTNASYSFTMFNNEKYTLMVEANGFAPVKYTLDPAQASTDKRLVKDIELTPNEADNNAKHVVGHVMRLNNLIFQLGNSKISPDSYGELNMVVNMMKENTTMVIQLEGHTDYQGNPKDNMKLSQQRVDAVKNYVVSKGISKKRIKTKAFGGTQPLSREDTPDAHRMNRRVELRILEN
jgi:outer membrane protein OmpA-like peptidoglycan-associated protein